jgi:hypothetical protein
VVVMIWMPHFPQHVAVPVGFQNHAALEGKAAEKILLRAAAVEKERPAFGQVAGQAWRVWQVPAVHHLAAEIDEVDGFASDKMRRKQREPRKGFFRIARAQAGAPAFESVLLDLNHDYPAPQSDALEHSMTAIARGCKA